MHAPGSNQCCALTLHPAWCRVSSADVRWCGTTSCSWFTDICAHLNLCRRASEAQRASIIADERRRLLVQAADLADYLPPGVLKDRQELELMRQQAASAAAAAAAGQ